jgi:uncharacterized delta-60 repeat protein
MTHQRQKFHILFSLSLILLFSCVVNAGGTLDPSFGTAGKVSFQFNGGTDIGRAAVLQPDGKIVIVGTTNIPGQSGGFSSFAVARLNADGSLDNTFGSGGKVLTDFGTLQEDWALAVAIQPDGKIVVGGHSNQTFAIARYNTDGSLDTTFNGGKVTTDFPGSGAEYIHKVMVQPDGKILAAGIFSGSFFEPRRIALARYNPDGTPDMGFGITGQLTVLIGSNTSFGGAAMQPDGKILISGEYGFSIVGCVPSKTVNCNRTQGFVARYTPQMLPDRKFGRRSGKEFTKWADMTDTLRAISLQADGKILIAGQRINRRYSSNGRVETIFATVPQQFIDLTVDWLEQRPDGKVAGCGRDRLSNHDDIVVALFNPNGSLVGTDRRDFFGGDDNCSMVLSQPDGKILVVGAAKAGQQFGDPYRFAVMRYLDITP